MSFNVAYLVGGILDRIRRLDKIEQPVRVELPLYPTSPFDRPYSKGFRLEIPATEGSQTYFLEHVVTEEAQLLSIEVGCTGYNDHDCWSFYIDGQPVCDAIYTKEVAQVKNLGAQPLSVGTVLRFEFANHSGTSKVAWLDINFALRTQT
jgi:hypothetical protein